MIIGITGSSGAGKSTVAEILENQYHAKTIMADKIAKTLSKKGSHYLNEIVENFGTCILQSNGELNRKKLANLIYHNVEKRNTLNSCTLKYIVQEIKEEIQNLKRENTYQLIALDAPLLFEANLDQMCDTTIAVISSYRETQLKRIMERDTISLEHAIARLNAQHSNSFYKENCQYTIINDGNVENIKEQLDRILGNILDR